MLEANREHSIFRSNSTPILLHLVRQTKLEIQQPRSKCTRPVTEAPVSARPWPGGAATLRPACSYGNLQGVGKESDWTVLMAAPHGMGLRKKQRPGPRWRHGWRASRGVARPAARPMASPGRLPGPTCSNQYPAPARALPRPGSGSGRRGGEGHRDACNTQP